MLRNSVAIIDYGVGNLLSVQRGVEYCGGDAVVVSTVDEILRADRLILPGVGAFQNGMNALNRLGFTDAILAKAKDGAPIFGICLGMQLLFSESEEFGRTNGLGLIPGKVVEIPGTAKDGFDLKIPNIGWRSLLPSTSRETWLGTVLEDINPGEEMYFVHSFTGECLTDKTRLAKTEYGGHSLTAVVQTGNVVGCQFHPEKSGDAGLRVLKRFVQT